MLLSPDERDFGEPVRVVVDGKTLFDERLSPRVATLLHRAARDEDRRRLFGAELTVDVTASSVARSGR